MLLVLLLGSSLRMIALEQSPPGIAPDEACNAYDAYSIWHTGRDQHGVLLPTVMRALNDYRMPLFVYSMAPLVGAGGLRVMNARLAAAFWGILAIAAAYWLGARLFGHVVGLVTASFLAVSPWHVPLTRIALEGGLTIPTTIFVVGLLWCWQRKPQRNRLIAAAVIAALGLYTYSVMKLFLVLMVAALGFVFWRTVTLHWRQVVVAALIGGVLAMPMLYNTLRYPDEMQARYREIAVFRPERPVLEAVQETLRNIWYNISPDFLFGQGDKDPLQHPPGMGQLYLVQAALIPVGFIEGLRRRACRLPLLINCLWILFTVLTTALTRPNLPGSGHGLRGIQAVVPWQMLSSLGVIGVLNFVRPRVLKVAAIVVIVGWVLLDGISYFNYYFTRYPLDAARVFNVGMVKAAVAMDQLDDDYEAVYFTCDSNWPYLYILFFTRYNPHLLQTDLPERGEGLFATVSRVGKYYNVCNTEELWRQGTRGLFIVPVSELPDVVPLAITPGFDGQPRYKIIGRQ
jgi:4-amino-4-deoxy-L-arabinose transferase-like glycosyltransferase